MFASYFVSSCIICIVRTSVFLVTEGLLAWKDNWVLFLDAMIQMQILAMPERDLRLPTRIRSLRIDPVVHEKFVRTLDNGSKGMVVVL